MGWVYLGIAGLLECGWAVGLKYTDGFTRLWPSVFSVLLIIASLGLLSLAMRTVPMGTAYAVWSGIGVATLAVYGIIFMGEAANFMRLVCIVLIVAGVGGLKYFAQA